MSDAFEKVKAAASRLKIFPLPSVVLLPGLALPLHVYEQRYRDMVRDALATDGVFAMAHVLPGQEPRLAETPELESMLGVGVIGLNEQDGDGRYNLVLIGVARARIVREHPQTHSYREVEAEILIDGEISEAEEASLRAAVFELIAKVPRALGERLAKVTSRVKGGLLADIVAGSVLTDVPDKFEVLNEVDVHQRVRVITHEALQTAGRLRPPKPESLLN
jgi:Lon protease-like protein